MAFNPERHCAALEEKIAEKERELAELRVRLDTARQKADEHASTRVAAETPEAAERRQG